MSGDPHKNEAAAMKAAERQCHRRHNGWVRVAWLAAGGGMLTASVLVPGLQVLAMPGMLALGVALPTLGTKKPTP